MTCGLVDIGCAIHKIIDPFWFWIQLGFWVVVALVVLTVLYRIKQVFGWQGVAAAIAAGTAAAIAIFSFKAGRDSVKPPENKKQPKPKTPKPKPPGKPSKYPPGTWNRDEDRWEPWP